MRINQNEIHRLPGGWPSLRRLLHRSLAALGALFLLAAAPPAWSNSAHSNPLNRNPLMVEAHERFNNLDYKGAVERLEHLRSAHPGDPYATAMLLEAVIFQELYHKDLLDTTFYSNDGFLTGRHAIQEDPRVRDRIFALADAAEREANARLARNEDDVDALYARGWERALKCAYMAMVERSFRSGFRLALKAKDDHKRVLELDPDYIDAKLVVGVYNYVVGALPLPFKILIGFVGVTGSKSEGLKQLNDVAHRGAMMQIESKVAIALFLRREAKYKQAIEVVREMKRQYPHNFLFWLEEANLVKDDGQGWPGVLAYRGVVEQAAKPGFFEEPQLQLAYFGLGTAYRGQRHFVEAAEAFEKVGYMASAGLELRIRSMLDAGECRDLNGERQAAIRHYKEAIELGPETSRADTARKRLKTPYSGLY
jgi:tetratricopeptide (TPR) repeat protein